MTVTTLIHLVLRLMSGAILLLPHMSLWNGQGLYVLPFDTWTGFLECGSIELLTAYSSNVALPISAVCCPPVPFMWPASVLDNYFIFYISRLSGHQGREFELNHAISIWRNKLFLIIFFHIINCARCDLFSSVSVCLFWFSHVLSNWP